VSGKVNKAIRRRAEQKTEGYKPVKYNTYRKKRDDNIDPRIPRRLMLRVHPKSTKAIVKLIKEAARYFDKNGNLLSTTQNKTVSRLRKRKHRERD
jgi:hypothetical protein